jgi:hypothetical protein
MSYELYGLRTDSVYGYGGWTDEKEEVRELLATFSTIEKAEQYVSNSMLKAAKDKYFIGRIKRGNYKFKKASLLREYDDYEICRTEESPPHNPII